MNLYEQVFSEIIKTELPEIDIVPQYKWHPFRRFKADFAIPEYKILIEIEGGIWNRRAHGSIRGILNDIEKSNLAQAEGWKLFRVVANGRKGLPGFLNADHVIEAIKRSINGKKQREN